MVEVHPSPCLLRMHQAGDSVAVCKLHTGEERARGTAIIPHICMPVVGSNRICTVRRCKGLVTGSDYVVLKS